MKAIFGIGENLIGGTLDDPVMKSRMSPNVSGMTFPRACTNYSTLPLVLCADWILVFCQNEVTVSESAVGCTDAAPTAKRLYICCGYASMIVSK